MAMNDTLENAGAVSAVFEPSQSQDELVAYFRIDFDRCVIERGDRLRRAAQPTTRQGVLLSGSSAFALMPRMSESSPRKRKGSTGLVM